MYLSCRTLVIAKDLTVLSTLQELTICYRCRPDNKHFSEPTKPALFQDDFIRNKMYLSCLVHAASYVPTMFVKTDRKPSKLSAQGHKYHRQGHAATMRSLESECPHQVGCIPYFHAFEFLDVDA